MMVEEFVRKEAVIGYRRVLPGREPADNHWENQARNFEVTRPWGG